MKLHFGRIPQFTLCSSLRVVTFFHVFKFMIMYFLPNLHYALPWGLLLVRNVQIHDNIRHMFCDGKACDETTTFSKYWAKLKYSLSSSCFIMVKAFRRGKFIKCGEGLNYCLILGPLFWERPHTEALPCTLGQR
jgi:hypothetical protein